MTEKDLKIAHKHSIFNENEILASDYCGCFFCEKIFEPKEIKIFMKEKNNDIKTALCPYCNIDSVIGSQSKFDINPELLKEMHNYFFDGI